MRHEEETSTRRNTTNQLLCALLAERSGPMLGLVCRQFAQLQPVALRSALLLGKAPNAVDPVCDANFGDVQAIGHNGGAAEVQLRRSRSHGSLLHFFKRLLEPI